MGDQKAAKVPEEGVQVFVIFLFLPNFFKEMVQQFGTTLHRVHVNGVNGLLKIGTG
jgi:hypothetical protein